MSVFFDLIHYIFQYSILDHEYKFKDEFFYLRYPEDSPNILSKDSLPEKDIGMIRIITVSDTHDRFYLLDNMPQCDIFIHCGDITMLSRKFSTNEKTNRIKIFNEWLATIPALEKYVIGGNHDICLEEIGKEKAQELLSNAIYLENSFYQSMFGFTLFGTPLSVGRSSNKAFQSKKFQETMSSKLSSAKNLSILISHDDRKYFHENVDYKFHFYGHIHEKYGVKLYTAEEKSTKWSICSSVNDNNFKLNHRVMVLDIPLNHLNN